MLRVLLCLSLLSLPWTTAQAIDSGAIMPTERIEYQAGVDMPGNDLRAIFQTDLKYCASVCRNESSCRGFTFNGRADACFLKSETASPPTNFVGALSGTMVATDPALLNHAAGQPLGFFRDRELNRARALYEFLEPVQGNWSYLDESIRGNQSSGWLGLMHRAQESEGRPRFLQRWSNAEMAFLVNAWLRAEQPDEQRSVLRAIIDQLEEEPERGPDILAAYRLLTELTGDQAQLERALLTYGPRVMDTRAEAESSAPRFCAEFSEPLREDGFLYGDYVQATGGEGDGANVDVDVSAEGKRLCITGLEHGGEYHIVLRQGLPAASGEVMAREQTFDLVMPDRSPSVRFSGRGYVLPQGKTHQIPITAVNTDRVEVNIYHVADRSLTNLLRGDEWLNPLDRYQASELAEEEGSLVWEGEASVASERNQDTVSLLDIGSALEVLEPGIYAITARPEDEDSYQLATQWFLVSDTSLTTFSGPDGLHVFVSRFSDGSQVSDGEVQLVARNNSVLHRAEINDQGYVRIAPQWLSGGGGDRPALLTAVSSGGTDFNFINLREAGFDLSDRGVAGHPAPQSVNIFATTERGIYRPGASVFATVLARDLESRAIADMPLTMIAVRPDGKEHSRQTLNDQAAGGRVGQLDLDASAMHGLWKLRFHADPEAEALAEVSFLVEDFVPERIDFDLDSRQAEVSQAEPAEVAVNARYLYGAPGAGLSISGKVTRRPVVQMQSYPGYRFGIPASEDQSTSALLAAGQTTDAEGKARVTLPVPPSAAAGQVESLTLNMQIREGSGRPVERKLRLPMALEGVVIGLQPLFDRVVAEGSDATFELVALGEGRTAQELDGVEWTLSRISRDYQWYKVNGEWGYSAVERRSREGHGSLDIAAEDGGQLSVPVDWGQYELELRAEVDGQPVVTRHTFWAGYYGGGGGSADTPDRLSTGLDRTRYQVGDELKLLLDARHSGIAEVRVLNGRLVETQRFDVEEGANELSLTVDERWGAGAYLVTSLITPRDQARDLNPRRAIGVNWVGVDASQRTIELAMAPVEPLKSRQDNKMTLSVENVPEGESVYATVAVVDLGILNLTGFKAPQPEEEFFGQRRLAFEMRDLHGRLIENVPGATAAMREGGDSNTPGQQAPGPRREEYVTVFSGLVDVDANGEAVIDLPLPAFNGSVRAMATAWSETGLGSLAEDFIVRDPIVLTAHAPSFLAPGDRAEVRLELAHAEGPTGEARVQLQGKGPISVAGNGTQTVNLDEGEHRVLTFELTALDPGAADLNLELETPAGEVLTQTLPLDVRYNDLSIQRRQQFPVEAGAALQLPETFTAGMAEDSTLSVSFGGLADFHVPAVAQSLYTLAWGCTEQLISGVEPLLSARDVLPDEAREKAAEHFDEVIAGVLSRQSPTGAFGDWAPESNNFWLDAYASEFLWRASQSGLEVPSSALNLAMRNLQNKVNGASYSAESRSSAAYSLYVLALAGEARASDLRYFADSWLDAEDADERSGLEGAWLGAALNEMGDPERASRLFQAAFEVLRSNDINPYSRSWDPYASNVRDRLIAYRLALTADYPVDREQIVNAIQLAADHGNSVEQANLLRVAARQLEEQGDAAASLSSSLDEYRHEAPLNPLDEDTSAAVTLSGAPTGEVAPRSSGVEISRRYYSLEGERIDVAELELNQRMLVVLTITPLATQRGQLAIEDPLPAGFNIDNPNVLSSADADGLEWFSGGIKPTHAEFADDHFFAAVDLRNGDAFELAYMVRAIRPGDFRHPAARVQDMYLPHLQANTASGRVVIGGVDEDGTDKAGVDKDNQ